MALNIDSTTIQLAQRRLDVISNNISNANTVGYKTSTFEQVLGATGKVTDVTSQGSMQNFAQGGISDSTDPLDIAVNGKGFFRLTQNGEPVYTRNGQFSVDKQGFIVNADGDQLTGYGVQKGTLQTIEKSVLVPLKIDALDQYPPDGTKNLQMRTALDCRKGFPTTDVFSNTDASSYTDTTTVVVHDNKGTPLSLQFYYVKKTDLGLGTPQAGWDLHVFNGNQELTAQGGSSKPFKFVFDDAGKVLSFYDSGSTTASSSIAQIKPQITVSAKQDITLDLTDTTAFASPFSAVMSSHDGVELGTISKYQVEDDGTINASYSNGKQKALGQIVLANFSNPAALNILDNSQWKATDGSGPAQIYIPGVEGTGTLKGFSTEDSNVDLSSEMIKLIAAQRAFQSAAQVINREDENLQTLVNIGR